MSPAGKVLSPKRILVFRTDRIGDVLLTTPVFEAIKKKYPESILSVVVSQSTKSIVQGSPYIDSVYLNCEKKGIVGFFDFWRLIEILKQKRFDVVVHLNPVRRDYWVSFWARIPMRIGYQVKNHQLLTHKIREEKQFGRKHEVESNFDLLAFLKVPKPEKWKIHFPLLSADKEKRASLFSTQKPYAVFHPSASCPSKIWSAERFALLADEMFKQYGLQTVIVGDGDGLKHAAQMERAMSQKPVNLSGQLSLGMLAWLLKEARILISNDSGPVHLAGAVQTPVISLFGRNRVGLNPERWKPISEQGTYIQKDVGCVECLAHACRLDFLCLKELTVDDVLQEVNRYESILV